MHAANLVCKSFKVCGKLLLLHTTKDAPVKKVLEKKLKINLFLLCLYGETGRKNLEKDEQF